MLCLETMCTGAHLSVTPGCITIQSVLLRIKMGCAHGVPTFNRLVDGYSSDLGMRPQVPQVHRPVAPAGQQRPVVRRQRQRRHRAEVALRKCTCLQSIINKPNATTLLRCFLLLQPGGLHMLRSCAFKLTHLNTCC
jgi:hypothetical protein